MGLKAWMAVGLAAAAMAASGGPATRPATEPAGERRAVTFVGGHETEGQDRGRPVVLVAAGLGVPSEVFRDAFSKAHPAPPGTAPDQEQVRQNKKVLLDALGKYGVTNERLDEVSNYYRYRRESGQIWTHREAKAYAKLGEDGKVAEIVITDAGAGYSTPPEVMVEGKGVGAKATLDFEKDLRKNGSIAKVELGK